MKKSFTLVELLVVISIIGILAATILIAVYSARKKAFDARVQGNMDQIRTLAVQYGAAKGNYEGLADVSSGYAHSSTCKTSNQCSDFYSSTTPPTPLPCPCSDLTESNDNILKQIGQLAKDTIDRVTINTRSVGVRIISTKRGFMIWGPLPGTTPSNGQCTQWFCYDSQGTTSQLPIDATNCGSIGGEKSLNAIALCSLGAFQNSPGCVSSNPPWDYNGNTVYDGQVKSNGTSDDSQGFACHNPGATSCACPS